MGHELDVYLQQQKRSFARYADNFVICVKSTSAAWRVKANVTRFLDKRLKLRINNDKSKQDEPLPTDRAKQAIGVSGILFSRNKDCVVR